MNVDGALKREKLSNCQMKKINVLLRVIIVEHWKISVVVNSANVEEDFLMHVFDVHHDKQAQIESVVDSPILQPTANEINEEKNCLR